LSWPLASFLIVGIVLACGWLAYERTRLSGRMMAVVATLAAVAALGRDAFVAVPDVKPITAFALVVGYALGPLPGFSVGALGMLASNIVLGQGPYTPWQMAAWGLVGLLGAGLGRLSARRLGRVPLALACACSALGAKEIMNVYTWTLGASHTPAAFLAVAGEGLPFDLLDTVASLLFGLAFAPELARLLARMRARMDVRWEPTLSAPLAMLALALSVVAAMLATAGGLAIAKASPARMARLDVSRELSFLAGVQNTDGGFGGAHGQPTSELYSAWVAMGLAAGGRDPLSLRRNAHTVLDALRREASTLQGAGDLERTILALHACGASVYSLDGRDPVVELLRMRSSDGSFQHQVNLTAFAIFALRAAGHSARYSVIRAGARWIEHQQDGDGGFGFAGRSPGGNSDVDDSAAALQGLLDAAARDTPVLSKTLAFLVHAQNPDGGYPLQAGGESNAQSTAWAIQGLVAAGRDVSAVRRHSGSGGSRSPLGYLESLLTQDGSVRYSRTSAQTPVWVTAQALLALSSRPFPVEDPR
jgi:hypothetical protein